MRGKKYQAAKAKAPVEAVDVGTAVAFLKEHATGKVDQTIEVHIHLGVDASKSDQMVRGTVSLPAGTPKQKKIAVFAATPEEQAAAKQAGAVIAGGEELINEVAKSGKLDADVVIATPGMMPKIAKVARVLGPQGLMPNPKTGTVTPDPVAVIKELAAGKVSFKMDSLGNIHEAVGKVSWEAAKITVNVQALLQAVRAARPTTMKGQIIRNCVLKSTMSPAIKLVV